MSAGKAVNRVYVGRVGVEAFKLGVGKLVGNETLEGDMTLVSRDCHVIIQN